MSERQRPVTFYFGVFILLTAGVVALLAARFAPYDPHLLSGDPLNAPSSAHWLGTNDLGQDQFSQLVYGARTTLYVALIVVAISTVMSWLVGLTAGFFRSSEALLMGVVDLLLALPSIPLYLLIIALTGASRLTLALMLGFLSWPAYARIVRSLVLQTRSSGFVDAARASGAPEWRIVLRHVLPATLDILPTKLTLTLRYAIFAEATLAFLGLGATGSISWGTMLSWAFNDPLLFSRSVWPWLVLPPAIAVTLLILAAVWVSGGLGAKVRSGAREVRSAARVSVHEKESEAVSSGLADQPSSPTALIP